MNNNNNITSEEQVAKVESSKLFKFMLTYTKPFFLPLLLCLVLIAVFTFIQILHPVIIMVSIDDLIDTRDRKIAVYNDYEDFSGISYGGNFYSNLSYRYKKPDYTMRLIKKDDLFFWIDSTIIYDNNSEIIENKEQFFLKNGNEITLINKANDSFVSKLDTKNKENLLTMSITFIILLILSFIFEYAQGYLISVVAQKIVHNMRVDIFKHMILNDMDYFQKNPVGRLVTRVTNDMTNISNMYSQVILYAIKDVSMMIAITLIMFSINIELSIITLLLVPLVILAFFVFKKLMLKVERVLKIQLASINSKLSEYINNIKIIQTLKLEDTFSSRFENENIQYKNSNYKMITLRSLFYPILTLSMGLSLAFLMYYGSNIVLKGVVQIGILVAFTKYLRQFYMPFYEFSNRFTVLQEAIASIERVYLIKQVEAKIVSPKNPININKIKGDVEFKNVSFTYESSNDNQKKTINNVSFSIKAGETCAIVGHTGSGKTTIINLLYRFYEPSYGEILIDNIPINEIDIKTLRKSMSMVLQDIMIFSDTIKENIRLYDNNISDERILEATRIVNADKFISHLENGYNHLLQEGGNDLSMGEKQLLSFARAIAHNPKILILDEATSNIDSETEFLIQDAIEKMKSKRTMIVIAHRLSTIKKANKIIVLDKGVIAEFGTHEELLSKNGIYKKLYTTAEILNDVIE